MRAASRVSGALAVGVVVAVAAVVLDLGVAVYAAGAVLALAGAVGVATRAPRLRWLAAPVAAVVVAAVALLVVPGVGDPGDSRVGRALAAGGPRVGDTVYETSPPVSGPITALDARSGSPRWNVERAALVAATPEVAVIATTEAGDGSRLTGRDARTGAPRWSRRVPGDVSGIASSEGVVVTAVARADRVQTVAFRIGTGAVAWRDARHAPAMELQLGDPANRYRQALDADAVLLFGPTPDRDDDPYAVVRVRDGHVLTRDLPALTGRISAGVLIGDDRSGRTVLAGWSTTTGRRLWRTRVADISAVAADATSAYVLTDSSSDPVLAVDLDTGSRRVLRPPAGWRVARFAFDHQQLGRAVWERVSRAGEDGFWRLGSDTVVPLHGATAPSGIRFQPASGSLNVEGTREDAVGADVDVSWRLSPQGRLSGPFRRTGD